ncbi:uncharacterized protein LOC122757304 [Drosophila mojavensis]|uniref:uncharacterized protein LOC122757304 n=1 Tax=Drosophila mojavensis TaxID=7230 RepID=UPI001CD05F83|nr:uncharacterized protein LOC122757304 [Drosophila mojavensis]
MREELAWLVNLHKTAEKLCNRPVKNCEVQTMPLQKVVEKASTSAISGSNTPKRTREVTTDQRKPRPNKGAKEPMALRATAESSSQAGRQTNPNSWTVVKGRKPMQNRPRTDCGNDCDLKGAWFRCGEMGHSAQACTKPPKCSLCIREGEQQTDHSAGSFKCPSYHEAARKTKC